ncbi:MAG: sugar phosphate nucleotidyltransferase [archaeon GB-1867-035]|nr:sugar phosphate nucleotidyltransferase [Candidatus Culexmicrobium profundum]
MIVKSAIIPAAGLGTRMLPYTKEVPKEMLPVVVKTDASFEFKPVLHFIFDALYDVGVRYFYFIVGRGKRIIEDYFTPDWKYVEHLEHIGKSKLADRLRVFYNKLEKCNILMVNQPVPRGFGDAVLRAAPFMASEPFFIHAGDDILYPNHSSNLSMMIDHYEKHGLDGVLLYEKVDNPELYGVIVGEEIGDYIVVERVVEKPKFSPSNNAIVAVYLFNGSLFHALKETKPKSGEHQLTDAIDYLLRSEKQIHALKIKGSRVDLGLPEHYLRALKLFSEMF